jgi:hypothetical protein
MKDDECNENENTNGKGILLRLLLRVSVLQSQASLSYERESPAYADWIGLDALALALTLIWECVVRRSIDFEFV